MEGSDEVTRRSDRLMATAVEEAQTLLGKRDPNALLAVALSNALAAVTVELRGLRLAQEALADLSRAGGREDSQSMETGEKES